MKKRFLFLIAVAAALSLFSVCLSVERTDEGKMPELPVKGLFIESCENTDFPSKTNLSARALKNEIGDILDYAVSAGYNTVFFEVRTNGGAFYSSLFPKSQYLVSNQGDFTFFDPLKEMIKAAEKRNISVYAVIDPYSLGNDAELLSADHPARGENASALILEDGSIMLDPDNEDTVGVNISDIESLIKKYRGLSGIIFENLLPTGNHEAAGLLLESAAAAVSGKASLGAFLPDDTIEEYPCLLEHLDIAMPLINAVTGFDEVNFASRLEIWLEAFENKTLIPYIDAVSLESTPEEYSAQIFLACKLSCGGFAVGTYSYLKNDEDFAGSLIASMQNFSDTDIYIAEYSPAQELSLTRPSSDLVTSYSSYFIMGTSDPEQPLTMNWKNVERQTDNGVFGILVDVAYGDNTFTFRQGSVSKTVTINRPYSQEGSSQTTTKISSMSPAYSALGYNGEEIDISCVAPSGVSVTAELNGTTVEMTQKYSASPGVPAVFTGSMPVSGASDGEVVELGPITYSIVDYGTEFMSSGSVFAAGDGAVPLLRVNTTSASLFYDENTEAGNFKSVLKTGITDKIIGSIDGYYEISSGYINRQYADIVTMDSPIDSSVINITTKHDEKSERFILEGDLALAYSFIDNDDGSIDLTLYGTSLPKSIDVTSDIFSSITWKDNGDNTITGLFVPKSSVWAMDVFPNDNGTEIYIRRTPVLSDEVSRPLKGISIVLDPGHGGTDPGAISSVNTNESDLNFSNATMLKYRLEQLGATVTLTRTSPDDTKSLFERVGVGQEVLPDFFIALHHNSIVEYADGYKHSGVEAYYYEDFGKNIAAAAVKHISQANYDRDYRQYSWGYYVVAKNRFAPSILCEIGFLPNPVESRYVSDEIEIYKTANAFCAAILEVISDAAQ